LLSATIKRFDQGFLREQEREPLILDVVNYLGQLGKSKASSLKYFENEGNMLSSVEVRTIHDSKGDEFDFVFIPQSHKIKIKDAKFNEDSVLSIKLEKLRGNALKIDEQKQKEASFETLRLIYVAITRAKKGLYITKSKENGEVFDLLKKLSGGIKI
jgi:ATP-dependent exoDNAse (exonuclease V) beta subunit